MRRNKIASQILLILSIFNFVLAAPVAVREINEVRVNAVDAAKVGMAVSEKRMDPGDEGSTNAAYLETTYETISSDTESSSSSDSDTATSRQPSTGSHPGPPGNPAPSHSVSTDDPPPQSPQPAPDHPPPPLSPQPAPDNSPPSSPPPDNSHPPPPNSGPPTGPHQLTDDHSPPSTEPQHHWALEYENFFSKLMKGRFKRSISGYGPGNVVQRELQGTVGLSADLDKLFNGLVASASGGVIGRGAGTPHKFQGDLQNRKKSVSRGITNLRDEDN